MRRLKNEIKAVIDKNKDSSRAVASILAKATATTVSLSAAPIAPTNDPKGSETKTELNTTKPVNSWTNEEVLKWLRDNQLSDIIVEAFKSYTGDDLAHL